jgi:hypothetical protein
MRRFNHRTSGYFSSQFFGQTSLLVKLFLWIPRLRCWKALSKSRGRPLVYPWHSIFRGLLFMLLKHLRHIPALERALRQSRRYRFLCGFICHLPCQRTWYRRFQQIKQIVAHLQINLISLIFKQQPLTVAAIDGSGIESYGRHASPSQNKHKPGDRDARWSKTVTKGWFQGYKLHCLSSTGALPIPLAWEVDTANSQEANFLDSLLQQTKETTAQQPSYLAADKAYDADHLFQSAQKQGVFLAAMLRRIRPPGTQSKKATLSRPLRSTWSKTALAQHVFKRRSDIERLFGHLKSTFLIDPLPVRHRANVTAYTHLCLTAYLILVAFNVTHQRPPKQFQEIMCSF